MNLADFRKDRNKKKCKYHCDYGDGEYCHYKEIDGCIYNKTGGKMRMTVKEYNNWYKSYNDAYSFVNNIDHAIEKAGCSANHQMQCIGWDEDVKQTLINALEMLKNQKKQMVVK